MTYQDIESAVLQISADLFSVDALKLTYETNYVEDLHADSLDSVELIMELEDEFDVGIPSDDVEHIKTVGDAVQAMASYLNIPTPPAKRTRVRKFY